MINRKLLVKKISEMLGISRLKASRMLRNGEIHLLKIDGKSGRPSRVDLNEFETKNKRFKGGKNE